jgi:hypothetical protein
MKRLVIMVVVFASLSGIATGTAAASVKVNASCGTSAASKRPSNLFFYCGDNGMIATGISWRSWGGKRAKGFGTISYRTCEPSCAAGGVVSLPGKVTLSRKVRCVKRRYEYSVLRAKAFGGPTRKVKLQTC